MVDCERRQRSGSVTEPFCPQLRHSCPKEPNVGKSFSRVCERQKGVYRSLPLSAVDSSLGVTQCLAGLVKHSLIIASWQF